MKKKIKETQKTKKYQNKTNLKKWKNEKGNITFFWKQKQRIKRKRKKEHITKEDITKEKGKKKKGKKGGKK